jgi:hypothetical protein
MTNRLPSRITVWMLSALFIVKPIPMSNSFNDHVLLFQPKLYAIIASTEPEMSGKRP